MPLLTPSSPALSPESRLSVAYADTRADELSYALDLPAQAALRNLRLEVAGVQLDLRILGYSHQVIAGGTAPLLTETVARLTGTGRDVPAALPRLHEVRRSDGSAGTLRYSLSASISRLGADCAAIAELMLELDGDGRAVLGVFPGHPHAFTGLRAGPAPRGVEWRSWHAYPGSDELVRTHSRLALDRA